MVGDSTWDCEAAGRAGIETVAVLTGGFSEAELREAGAAGGVRVDRGAARASRRNSTWRWRSDSRATAPSATSTRPPSRPAAATTAAGEGRFVVQEHHARSLHWDLRLEHDGVLVSWALPRGIPAHPDENRLAVHTEDHPLEYLDFEGEIPKGEYGAGTMEVWDSGTYEAEKFRDDEVIATFHGERLQGPLRAVRHARQGLADPPHGPAGRPELRADARPPRADAGALRRAAARRARSGASRSSGTASARSPSATTATSRSRAATSPTSRRATRRCASWPASSARGGVILDGEIVAFDERGPAELRAPAVAHAPGLGLGGQAPHARHAGDLRRSSTCSTSTATRRCRSPTSSAASCSRSSSSTGPRWRAPAYHRGEGSALLEATRELGIEGVVAKRLDSAYEPGRRSSALAQGQERLRAGRGDRRLDAGRGRPQRPALGALAVGVLRRRRAALRRQGRHRLHRADAGAAAARARAAAARRARPFEGRQPPKGTIFVEPRLVARVELREWTRSGTLRAPSFKGLRDDMDPQDCIREEGSHRPEGCTLEVHGKGDLERRDQLRAGQHPGEAVQRGLEEDRALPPDRRRVRRAHPPEARRPATARRSPTSRSSRATRSAPTAT